MVSNKKSNKASVKTFRILTVVSSFLAKRCGHQGEQRKPEGDKDTHVAQAVVAVQLVHQQDLRGKGVFNFGRTCYAYR